MWDGATYSTFLEQSEVIDIVQTGEDCDICGVDGSLILCDNDCGRAFHLLCVSLTDNPTEDWHCPECEKSLAKTKKRIFSIRRKKVRGGKNKKDKKVRVKLVMDRHRGSLLGQGVTREKR